MCPPLFECVRVFADVLHFMAGELKAGAFSLPEQQRRRRMLLVIGNTLHTASKPGARGERGCLGCPRCRRAAAVVLPALQDSLRALIVNEVIVSGSRRGSSAAPMASARASHASTNPMIAQPFRVRWRARALCAGDEAVDGRTGWRACVAALQDLEGLLLVLEHRLRRQYVRDCVFHINHHVKRALVLPACLALRWSRSQARARAQLLSGVDWRVFPEPREVRVHIFELLLEMVELHNEVRPAQCPARPAPARTHSRTHALGQAYRHCSKPSSAAVVLQDVAERVFARYAARARCCGARRDALAASASTFAISTASRPTVGAPAASSRLTAACAGVLQLQAELRFARDVLGDAVTDDAKCARLAAMLARAVLTSPRSR